MPKQKASLNFFEVLLVFGINTGTNRFEIPVQNIRENLLVFVKGISYQDFQGDRDIS